ncbi:hypothetical protein ACOBV8_18665 (plasmid) [Pseudoalteromonas espejiana]
MNLDRQDFDSKFALQASLDDDTLISDPQDVEQLTAITNMLINGGSVEVICFPLQKARLK